MNAYPQLKALHHLFHHYIIYFPVSTTNSSLCATLGSSVSSPERGMWIRLGQDVPVAIFVEGMVHGVAVQLWGWHVSSSLLVAGGGVGDLPLGSPALS